MTEAQQPYAANPDAAIDELRLQQIRADIARKTQEMLFEPRKYRIQFFSAVVSAFVAGGVISGVLVAYVNAHQTPPQPIVIQLQAPK
jgi:hypothetical protein